MATPQAQQGPKPMADKAKGFPWSKFVFVTVVIVIVLALFAGGFVLGKSLDTDKGSGNGSLPSGKPGTAKNPLGGNQENFNPLFSQTLSYSDWWAAYQAANPAKKRSVARAYERMTGYTIDSAKGFAQVEKVKGIGYYRVVLVSNTNVTNAQARLMASIGGVDASNLPVVRVSGIENTWLHGNLATPFWDARSQARLALVVPKNGWTLDNGFKKAGVLCMCGNPWRVTHGKRLGPPPPRFRHRHPGLAGKNWRKFPKEPKTPSACHTSSPIGTASPFATLAPSETAPAGTTDVNSPTSTAVPDSGSGATNTTPATPAYTGTPAAAPTDSASPSPGIVISD